MDDLERDYEVLGLKLGASPEEVKQAYRDLVKVWHPDRFPNNPRLQKKAQEKLKEINLAYERLERLLSFRPDLHVKHSRADGQNHSEPKRKPPEPQPPPQPHPTDVTPGKAAMRGIGFWPLIILIIIAVGIARQIIWERETPAPQSPAPPSVKKQRSRTSTVKADGHQGSPIPPHPDLQRYLETIRKKAEAVVHYPEGISGSHQVSVILVLNGTGEVVRVRPLKSTESRLSDSAIQALKLASPFSPLPETLKAWAGRPLRITLKIKPPIPLGPYKIIHPTSVYSEPREGSEIVARIEPGMQVHVVDAQGFWLQIESKHGRPPGFIKGESASPMNGKRAKERLEAEQATTTIGGTSSVAGTGEGQGATAPGSGGQGGGVIKGVQFMIYRNRMINLIKERWVWVGKRNDLEVAVRFGIKENGQIVGLNIVQRSDDPTFDDSVILAITAASPFPPPPESYRKEFMGVELTFRPKEVQVDRLR